MPDGYYFYESYSGAERIILSSQDHNADVTGTTSPPLQSRKRWLRLSCRSVLLVLVVLLVWLGTVRIYGEYRRIRVFSNSVSAPASSIDEQPLTVVTWNIAHGRGPTFSDSEGGNQAQRAERLMKIGDQVKSLEPDIVILNEVDFNCQWSGGVNQAEQLAEAIPLGYRMEQSNFDLGLPGAMFRCGNAVLSRFPIKQALAVEYFDSSTWEKIHGGKKRGALCSIVIPGGRVVNVVPIHLKSGSETVRVASMQRLLATLGENQSAILAGDFNSTRFGYPQGTVDAKYRTAISVLEEDGYWKTDSGITGAAKDFTFPSMAPQAVIDWIFASSDWTITDYRVIQTDLSDHNLVVAKLIPKYPDDENGIADDGGKLP